ncbi:hypothetical protein PR048_029656 [Dryococelus australis]|uniref:Uncharacterized protein n=1 Tax=Dryococelus australis TaxID=614101 RepID=A0ABQ9GEB0_9NEOP|nr:hypothetical protein PR048_029656 [Dryococelus australis]
MPQCGTNKYETALFCGRRIKVRASEAPDAGMMQDATPRHVLSHIAMATPHHRVDEYTHPRDSTFDVGSSLIKLWSRAKPNSSWYQRDENLTRAVCDARMWVRPEKCTRRVASARCARNWTFGRMKRKKFNPGLTIPQFSNDLRALTCTPTPTFQHSPAVETLACRRLVSSAVVSPLRSCPTLHPTLPYNRTSARWLPQRHVRDISPNITLHRGAYTGLSICLTNTGLPDHRKAVLYVPYCMGFADNIIQYERRTELLIQETLPPLGTKVAERLARSPPTKVNRVQSPAGRCRWSAGFLGVLPFPPPLHSGAAPYSLQSSSSALKTSLLRTAEISPRGNEINFSAYATGSYISVCGRACGTKPAAETPAPTSPPPPFFFPVVASREAVRDIRSMVELQLMRRECSSIGIQGPVGWGYPGENPLTSGMRKPGNRNRSGERALCLIGYWMSVGQRVGYHALIGEHVPITLFHWRVRLELAEQAS